MDKNEISHLKNYLKNDMNYLLSKLSSKLKKSNIPDNPFVPEKVPVNPFKPKIMNRWNDASESKMIDE